MYITGMKLLDKYTVMQSPKKVSRIDEVIGEIPP